jgi:grpE
MKKDKIVDKPEYEDSETPETELEQDIEANEEAALPEEEEPVDLEFLKAENQRLKEDFLRAYADAENIKKRCAQEIEKNNKYAISSFAKSLLSVADNLHRAIEAIPADKKAGCAEAQGLLKGVELTEAELMKVFDKFGVHKMEILNTVFDPNYHQVIQEVEDPDKPAGTIVSELQTGYMINDRILREAMVIVTKGGPTEH